jgi:hypothetical protein
LGGPARSLSSRRHRSRDHGLLGWCSSSVLPAVLTALSAPVRQARPPATVRRAGKHFPGLKLNF